MFEAVIGSSLPFCDAVSPFDRVILHQFLTVMFFQPSADAVAFFTFIANTSYSFTITTFIWIWFSNPAI